MDRRDALKSLGVGAMAAYGVGSPTWHRFRQLVAAGGAPGFFTEAELALLRILADLVIPRDERSGSATDSGAIEYMDFVVGQSNPKTQQAWRDGLRWFDEESARRFSMPFQQASDAQHGQLLDDIAWPAKATAAFKPQAQFFNRLRDLTGSAFFSSKMGVQDLGYLGNVPNPNWTGAPPAALRGLGVNYDEWDRRYGEDGR